MSFDVENFKLWQQWVNEEDSIASLDNAVKEQRIIDKFKTFSTGGQRETRGKLRVDLVPPEWEEALAEGLEAGLKKGYTENNWKKGLPFENTLASARRHINKWRKGEDIDEETGVHHLKLAMLNLGFVVYHVMKERKDLDDRQK